MREIKISVTYWEVVMDTFTKLVKLLGFQSKKPFCAVSQKYAFTKENLANKRNKLEKCHLMLPTRPAISMNLW